MKRIVLEWGLIFSVGTALTLSALWVFNGFVDRTPAHFQLSLFHDMRDPHVLVGDGRLWFFTQCNLDSAGHVEPLITELVPAGTPKVRHGGDASDGVRPLIIDARTWIMPKVRKVGRCTLPGFDLRYCRFASDRHLMWSLLPTVRLDGHMIWSLRLSLLYPIGLSLLGVVWFSWRLRALRRRAGRGPDVGSRHVAVDVGEPPEGLARVDARRR
jgi:hypothetical protein